MAETKADLDNLQKEISSSLDKWKKLRNLNRNWDAGLTVATISLTLLTSLLGVEGIPMNDSWRKSLIGLSGGIVVAIQSIGNAFPVKQRAGGYQLIQGQAYTLKSKLGYLNEGLEISDKLPQIREDYYKLIEEADKLEA